MPKLGKLPKDSANLQLFLIMSLLNGRVGLKNGYVNEAGRLPPAVVHLGRSWVGMGARWLLARIDNGDPAATPCKK